MAAALYLPRYAISRNDRWGLESAWSGVFKRSVRNRIAITAVAICFLTVAALLANLMAPAPIQEENRISEVPPAFAPYLRFANGRPGVIAADSDYPLSFSADRSHDLVNSYLAGLGVENRIYLPGHRMTRQLQDAFHVAKARAFFYNKYSRAYTKGAALKGASVTRYDAHFTMLPLLLAGPDLVEQFVGSYKLDMQVDSAGEQVLFILKNTTGNESAFFHLPFVHDVYRKPGTRTPGGNLNQVYIWQEPLAAVMEAGAAGMRPPFGGSKTALMVMALLGTVWVFRVKENSRLRTAPLDLVLAGLKGWKDPAALRHRYHSFSYPSDITIPGADGFALLRIRTGLAGKLAASLE